MKLKDKFYLWGQTPNSHACHNVPPSRMTAMEGCSYFGIERCCRVVMCSHPRPPFDQESIAMRPLKEVIWSIVGACGTVENNNGIGDLAEVIRQSELFPNITGGVLDDFFVSEERRAAFPPAALAAMRDKLKGGKRPLNLWMVIYATNLDLPIQPYIDLCDVLTFWTWKSEQLTNMEKNFDRLIAMSPKKRYLNGIYMYDYGNNRPMPIEIMKKQAKKYEEWLLSGKSDGLVLCSNCCADVNLEAVEWTRDWLKELGEQEV